jgi:hypothetical protein
MTFAFDTLAQAKRLREAGFDEKQAEALTAALRDVPKPLAAPDVSTLVTKAELAAGLAELRAKLTQWIVGWLAGIFLLLNAIVVAGTMLGLVKLMGR